MIVDTTRFGSLEVEDETVITFPEGIIGFESAKRFILFEQEEGGLFKWLQSVESPELAFVLIQPDEFFPNFSLEISELDASQLQLEDLKTVQIWAIVVIPGDPSKMTANLQGPIVINAAKNIGRQIISSNPRHKLRHYILEEMRKISESSSGNDPDSAGSEV